MIDSFEIGQKLILNRNYKHCGFFDLENKMLIVKEFCETDNVGRLMSEDGDLIYTGILDTKWFDYYGVHVNHEILDLVNKHDIKAFQAVLDDGRTVHISCLN